VWRAERPQKGRYRQFVQCDIDVIGESGPIAEVELITATAATLTALGLEGCVIRINDRRLLMKTLAVWGIGEADAERVLITLDKLDKVGISGVVGELRDNGFGESVEAIEAHLRQVLVDSAGVESASVTVAPTQAAIRSVLPSGVEDDAIEQLAAIAAAVEAVAGAIVQFDPWLVRGMGYYTGAIFEVAHPALGYSLGGGGRYDGMIGRFLGTEVPAAGFSLGFERLVELVQLPDSLSTDAAALVHDADVPLATLAALQSALVASGRRVRLERKPRNLAPLLAQLVASGFAEYAHVTAGSTLESLEFRLLR
jgi:histidyl-tRNA synthetase